MSVSYPDKLKLLRWHLLERVHVADFLLQLFVSCLFDLFDFFLWFSRLLRLLQIQLIGDSIFVGVIVLAQVFFI